VVVTDLTAVAVMVTPESKTVPSVDGKNKREGSMRERLIMFPSWGEANAAGGLFGKERVLRYVHHKIGNGSVVGVQVSHL
jgi:hypothetical protein